MDKWPKPIVIVWVDPGTRLRRLMARDRANKEDGGSRINSQMPLDLKRSKADIVDDNTGSLEDFSEQFQKAQFQVMRPLTWTEFALSRRGALLALFSIAVGVLAFIKYQKFLVNVFGAKASNSITK